MPDGSLRKILYVEDEPDIAAVARLSLESIGGFEMLVCGSGKEALGAAPGFAPDLILLDVMMPGMDGPSTLRALRATSGLSAIPIIFMTAKAQTGEVNRYREMGALDVITKPFDPIKLPDTIRDIWAARSR